MKGGWTPYRSPGAAAIKKYFYGPEAKFDNYYFQGTEPGCAERIIHRAGDGAQTVAMDAEDYGAWVDFIDPDTGESRGTVRKNSLRFLEKNINVDKSLSLAAVDSPEVAYQLRAAMREAAVATATYGGEHFTTRVTQDGVTRQVPVEQVEVAVIAHKTSRENEPHPHLHVQFSGRVYAGGAWRQLDTGQAWKHSAALNAHIEQSIHTHPGLRTALANNGFHFDPSTGKVAETAPFVEQFSTRHAQIEHNKQLLEQNWQAATPDQRRKMCAQADQKANRVRHGDPLEPGPGLRSAWDYMAWAGVADLEHIDGELIPRPEKTIEEPGSLEERWRVQLAEAGYRSPSTPAPEPGKPWPRRELLAEQTITALAGRGSAWSTADIRAEAARQITAAGVIADRETMTQRVEYLVTTAQQQCRSMADPRITPPETARHWTSQNIIDTEDELKTRLAARAAEPAPVLGAEDMQATFPMLNDEQAEAAAALAAGTRLSVIEGYAGAGKTLVLGAATEVRRNRPLLTVTPTLKAAQEARSAGANAGSLHKLLHANGYRWDQANQWTRLAPGETDPTTGRAFQPPAEDSEYHLTPETQIVVDEAGMLDQEAARALLTLADEHRADLALMGDRAQLSAVGRGGVLDMAARVATHHVELDQVHRFGADTDYAEISKNLRNRQNLAETFDRLYQRGNLRIHASEEEATAALAADAAADIQAGRSIAVTVPTNATAAELNASIQAQRIDTGQITAHQNPATGNDGLSIYAGDTIMTRSNNRDLGVANRESFRVVSVHQDGALTIAGEDQRHQHIDAGYVAQHVHLGYAVTDYGNQGTTVDHGSALLEDGMSGGGAYVGATRGREDNTLHLVAEDPEAARAKFTSIMGTDRADRGLDQARTELAEELARTHPEPAPKPLDDRVQRYIDRLEKQRAGLERYAEHTKPLHDYQQQVEDFRTRHGSTLADAQHQESAAERQARKAQQHAQEVYQDQRTELYQQARNEVGYQMRSLQTIESHARNAGIIDLKGTKTKAQQQRESLEAEHGIEIPRGKRRIKHENWTEDHQWVDQVAKNTVEKNLPTDPAVLDAQQQARHAAEQAQQAITHREHIAQRWDAEVGDKPQIPLRTDNKHVPITYEKAQRRIEKIDQRITYASNPENQNTVLEALDNAQQRRQAQNTRRKPTRAPELDPHNPAYQAPHKPPTRDTGPELGR